MAVFRLVLIICVTVHMVECQVALVMNKYEFLPACWEPYGTVLANFLRVRSIQQCGAKCTGTPSCESFLFSTFTGWCQLNTQLFVNRTTTGCSWLADYGQITSRDPVHVTPSSTHCVDGCTNDVNGFRLCDGLGAGLCDPKQGRIEVLYNNEWGTICDDGWSQGSSLAVYNVDVTCRMFGYHNGGESRDQAFYGSGNGSIWLDDVTCTGNENTLMECSNIGWGSHNCMHAEDQGVLCY